MGVSLFHPSNREIIQHRTLGDAVVERIIDAILFGDIQPGQRLTEEPLAERFGVSRGPVREAIRRLQEDGLIEKVSHSPAHVRRWTYDEFRDLIQFRSMLEAYAAQLAAQRRSEQDLDLLWGATVRLERAWQSREIVDLVGSDLDLHMLVGQASHHAQVVRTLTSGSRQMQVLLIRVLGKKMASKIDSLEQSVAQHRQIIQRVQERDAVGASKKMEHHILASLEILDEVISSE